MADRRRPRTKKPWTPAPKRVREEIGEDPAKFLRPKTSIDPWPRIKGIDDRETAAAWLAVIRLHGYADEYERRLQAKITTMKTRAETARSEVPA